MTTLLLTEATRYGVVRYNGDRLAWAAWFSTRAEAEQFMVRMGEGERQ